MPTLRLLKDALCDFDRLARSWPSTDTAPAVASRVAARIEIRVVLPQPDGRNSAKTEEK